MEIRRDIHLRRLIASQHNGLIKVVTGIRRCGKSYLLRVLFKNYLIENGVLSMSLQRLFADAEVLENMMKNLIARYRLACNLPYMQDGLTQIGRK